MRNNIALPMLRLFLRVAETRSFCEASRLENMSQPALSRTIRLLEDQLRVRLFDRTTRSVELTKAGAQLLPVAERLLADVEQAFSELTQSFSGHRGLVTLGTLPSIAATVLPPVLARFQPDHPLVQVQIVEQLADLLAAMVTERRLDFALSTIPEPNELLSFRPLLRDQFVLVCRSDHPLASDAPLPWATLAGHEVIALAPRSSVRLMTDSVCQQLGLVLAHRYECGQLATVGGLIREGLGVCCLPLLSVPLLGGTQLVTRPLVAPELERRIGIVSLKSRTISPAALALLALFGDFYEASEVAG